MVTAVPSHVTFRGGTGVSTIDYFCLNNAIVRGHRGVHTVMQWHKKAPRPVQLSLVDSGRKIQHYVYTVSAKLPATPPPVPLTQPIDWTLRAALARQALELAQNESSDLGVSWAFLSNVHGKYAVTVAEYAAQNAGVDLEQPGAHARNLEPRWVDATSNILDGNAAQSAAQGWQWLQGNIVTIQKLYAQSDQEGPMR
eukprot:6069837-Pyramimonas_sp.AAC.1